jgi:hypothetical protein
MVGRNPAPGASSAHAHLRGRGGLTGFTTPSLRAQRTAFTDTRRYARAHAGRGVLRSAGRPLEPPGAGRALRGQRLSRWRLATSCYWWPWLRLFNPPLVDWANPLQSRGAHRARCGAGRQCDCSETESVFAAVACERPDTLFVGATSTVIRSVAGG